MELIFGVIIGAALAVPAIILVCRAILSVIRSNRKNTKQKKESEEKLCPNCLTGAETYKLDMNSQTCPYLYCHTGEECPYYKPLPSDARQSLPRDKKKNIKSPL